MKSNELNLRKNKKLKSGARLFENRNIKAQRRDNNLAFFSENLNVRDDFIVKLSKIIIAFKSNTELFQTILTKGPGDEQSQQ